jgi:protein-disulfide isomerase
MQEGSRLGVTGTPTFFINGRLLVGNQPIGEFQKVIDRELSRSTAR